MANLTTDFEVTLLAQAPNPGNRTRGLMAGANYKLRQLYQRGFTDPTAHTLAKNNPEQVAALNGAGNMALFDAITGP